MKKIMTAILILSVLLGAACAFADDATIRILMLDGPDSPLPGEDAVKLRSLNGRVRLDGRFYEGRLDIVKDSRGLYVVKTMPIEEYVRMVVASEMGEDGNVEAMKSQAVVTRTYAIYKKWQNTGRLYHIASPLHADRPDGGNDPYVNYAVNSTRGEVLTFNGLPINAVYHSTCEGMTELPEEIWGKSYPYLKSVACYSKNAPFERWQRRYTPEELERKIGVAGLRDIFIKSRTVTGRASTISIIFNDKEKGITYKDITARNLVRMFGEKEIPSTDFEIGRKGLYYIFNGRGRGHAVGLSQWGAIEMAWEGKSYREILAHFYPGAELQKREEFYTGVGKKDSVGQ
jgi:stage II sporulation protein D